MRLTKATPSCCLGTLSSQVPTSSSLAVTSLAAAKVGSNLHLLAATISTFAISQSSWLQFLDSDFFSRYHLISSVTNCRYSSAATIITSVPKSPTSALHSSQLPTDRVYENESPEKIRTIFVKSPESDTPYTGLSFAKTSSHSAFQAAGPSAVHSVEFFGRGMRIWPQLA